MIAAHVPVIAIAPALTIFGGPGIAPTRYPVVPVLLGLAMGAIQLRHSFAAARGERPRFALATFALLAILVYLPMEWFGWAWAASQALLVASAAMMLRGRAGPGWCAPLRAWVRPRWPRPRSLPSFAAGKWRPTCRS